MSTVPLRVSTTFSRPRHLRPSGVARIAALSAGAAALSALFRLFWTGAAVLGFRLSGLFALLALALLTGLVGRSAETDGQKTHSYSNLNRTAPLSVEFVKPKR